jgi:TatD DNase family protein
MEQVIERAKNVGVTKMLVTGGNLEESLEAINLCKKYPNYLFSTVGCHPTRCNEFLNNPEDYLNKLSTVIENNLDCVAAIGEFGLDYDRLHFCEAEVQKKYFELQFSLSEKFKLPLFLHCRNTGTDFATIVKANRHRFADGVVHSFTGSYDEAKELIDLGLYIGINGCSMKTAENLEVVKKLPIDRLMIETDAPWCDIRPTHASYEFIKNHEDIPEWKVVKKEKFQLGSLVKSRNEPCQLM